MGLGIRIRVYSLTAPVDILATRCALSRRPLGLYFLKVAVLCVDRRCEERGGQIV
jgi:hypothetical protein